MYGSRTAVSCPLPVKIYNEKMGGVDLADSKRQVYSCTCKLKKWWHRLFYYVLLGRRCSKHTHS